MGNETPVEETSPSVTQAQIGRQLFLIRYLPAMELDANK